MLRRTMLLVHKEQRANPVSAHYRMTARFRSGQSACVCPAPLDQLEVTRGSGAFLVL